MKKKHEGAGAWVCPLFKISLEPVRPRALISISTAPPPPTSARTLSVSMTGSNTPMASHIELCQATSSTSSRIGLRRVASSCVELRRVAPNLLICCRTADCT